MDSYVGALDGSVAGPSTLLAGLLSSYAPGILTRRSRGVTPSLVRVPGGLEESRRDSKSSSFAFICAARLRIAGSFSHDNVYIEGLISRKGKYASGKYLS